MLSHFCFYLHFPSMMLNIFLSAYWPFVSLLWINVSSNPLLIFKLGYFPFIELQQFLYVHWIQVSSDI